MFIALTPWERMFKPRSGGIIYVAPTGLIEFSNLLPRAYALSYKHYAPMGLKIERTCNCPLSVCHLKL
jgi:hypothetical protein